MASRATRYLTPIFRSSFRPSQAPFRASGRRGMTANTSSPSKKSSDMPWIIGSGLVFVPTIAWILSSGKGENHAHPTSKAPKEHTEDVEADREPPKEHSPEPVIAEPTPELVPEENSAKTSPEPSASESVVSDDEGVEVSKEELEESINKAVNADVPKETKVVETSDAPTPSKSVPVKDEAAPPPKKETTESTPPPASDDSSTEKKETKSH